MKINATYPQISTISDYEKLLLQPHVAIISFLAQDHQLLPEGQL